jgi:hypothetical protein
MGSENPPISSPWPTILADDEMPISVAPQRRRGAFDGRAIGSCEGDGIDKSRREGIIEKEKSDDRITN